jgi:hypothetical protein
MCGESAFHNIIVIVIKMWGRNWLGCKLRDIAADSKGTKVMRFVSLSIRIIGFALTKVKLIIDVFHVRGMGFGIIETLCFIQKLSYMLT